MERKKIQTEAQRVENIKSINDRWIRRETGLKKRSSVKNAWNNRVDFTNQSIKEEKHDI